MPSSTTPMPRLTALRHRDFRLLWIGALVSTIGSQMQLVAVNWHVYRLLHGAHHTLTLAGRHLELNDGALGLGVLGLVRVLPIMLFGLLGGMLADAFDRRAVIMGSQVLAAATAATLAAITLTGHITIAALYLLTALEVAVTAFDEPAQQALVPRLVSRSALPNAATLYSLLWMLGTIVGPAAAGLLIARFAIGDVYALNAASFLAVLLAVAAMRYRGTDGVARSTMSRAALVEGLRFTRGTRLIWSTLLIDWYATFFSSARTMLPIIADHVLHAGVQGYGLLATAQPVGAVGTGVVLSLRRGIRRQGAVMLISVAVYGLATALFGLSRIFVLSYVLFALTGAGDTVSTMIRATIRQLLTPDEMRGRMAIVHLILGEGGPQLGELEAGLVAAAVGAPFAIVTGGLITVLLTAWVGWRQPDVRRYVGVPEHHIPAAS